MTSGLFRSIWFGGHNFSPYTTAEARVAPAVPAVVALVAPGRPGMAATSSVPGTREIRVRLYLDLEKDTDADGLLEVRRDMAGWLGEGAGDLRLPGVLVYSFHDVVLRDASFWESLFEEGSCELVFEALDPYLYGASGAAHGQVGATSVGVLRDGTAPAPPEVVFTASAGDGFTLGLEGSADKVEVAHTLDGTETVRVDCAAERVYVDGVAADADVACGSVFFALPPGTSEVVVTGGHDMVVYFREAWL
ncbi:hypothetical protein B5F74_02235 [Collinsella sp. An271]|uniref:phage distal tail protein n=1 Tax=Collinsella sp. An271 TaxID=1965616 RepID=UPI000B39EA98|nr:phage tail domain-containing protein [Collinsella sp. An271]OUO62050.1 hypothetical protein B5F74_02235 [Collinsella sp. An271]